MKYRETMSTESEKIGSSSPSGKCTLFVCTSCRPTGFPREPKEDRPGFLLYHKILEALEGSDLQDSVNVEAAKCLSLCPRPCGVALTSGETWTYLFGDQDPATSVASILECVSIYLKCDDGEMPRGVRPPGLRESILGRLPPLTKKVGDLL